MSKIKHNASSDNLTKYDLLTFIEELLHSSKSLSNFRHTFETENFYIEIDKHNRAKGYFISLRTKFCNMRNLNLHYSDKEFKIDNILEKLRLLFSFKPLEFIRYNFSIIIKGDKKIFLDKYKQSKKEDYKFSKKETNYYKEKLIELSILRNLLKKTYKNNLPNLSFRILFENLTNQKFSYINNNERIDNL